MLRLSVLREEFGICRLKNSVKTPAWAMVGSFFSITKTPDELSIVCRATLIPEGVTCEKEWRCLKVQGPLDFSQTGVLSSLVEPLAQAGISIFVMSTYYTDYLLIKENNLSKAIEVLSVAGHKVSNE